jgi:hypothetical protein
MNSANSKMVETDSGKEILSSYCTDNDESITRDMDHNRQQLEMGPVFFSYEVIFKVNFPNLPYLQESEKAIGSRWDAYQFLGDEEIHWLSILNSFVITLVLTLIIAHILRRTIRKDLKEYNEVSIKYRSKIFS